MAGSGTAHLSPPEEALLRVEHLVVEYPHGLGEKVHAVSDVSLDVRPGETLGIVGESGCGKSTLARAIVQLVRSTSGRVVLGQDDLAGLNGRQRRRARLRVQMVFQDPISSLNPRRRVRDIVAEGLRVQREVLRRPRQRAADDERVGGGREDVGLDRSAGARRSREFSGGQCQRISIARALVTDPEVLVCDEPVSALDVSVQAQILNLLESMKVRYGLTMIFIAHDLAVVKNISDRVAVMYLGKLCEVAPADRLYEQPLHPYTLGLLQAIPEPDPNARLSTHELLGDPPSPIRPPSGCRFRTRCDRATERCADEEPVMRELLPGQFVACHHPVSVDALANPTRSSI
jgi:peptide/nickel transport system ATP-binding protein